MVLLFERFFFTISPDFPVILILDLNDSEFAIAAAGLSLSCCYKLPDVFEYLLLILLTLFRMGQDGGRGKKAPLPKICHTYPTKMKLGTAIPYLRKTQEIY